MDTVFTLVFIIGLLGAGVAGIALATRSLALDDAIRVRDRDADLSRFV